jgi:hypothetical protein
VIAVSPQLLYREVTRFYANNRMLHICALVFEDDVLAVEE